MGMFLGAIQGTTAGCRAGETRIFSIIAVIFKRTGRTGRLLNRRWSIEQRRLLSLPGLAAFSAASSHDRTTHRRNNPIRLLTVEELLVFVGELEAYSRSDFPMYAQQTPARYVTILLDNAWHIFCVAQAGMDRIKAIELLMVIQ